LQLTGDLSEHLLELGGVLIEKLLQIAEQLTRGGNGGRNTITPIIVIPAPRCFSGEQTCPRGSTKSRL
jgi:hypothetical protein